MTLKQEIMQRVGRSKRGFTVSEISDKVNANTWPFDYSDASVRGRVYELVNEGKLTRVGEVTKNGRTSGRFARPQ